MKNIHVIETNKPSRSMIDTIENKLYLQPILHEKTVNVLTQNIYITSSEEIKEGDWVIQINFEKTNTQLIQCITKFQVKLANDKNGSFTKNKIILTTDQDLDGVQEIDDEFLEWFVKNPSCEFVETGSLGIKNSKTGKNVHYKYLITIPQEEPKQDAIEYSLNAFKVPKEYFGKEEPKQELPIINGSYGCTIETKKQESLVERMIPLQLKYNLDKMKQETLEEAGVAYAKTVNENHTSHMLGFHNGAKWQQERSYSEEDMREAFYQGWLLSSSGASFKDALKKFIEQNKKK